MSRATAEPAVAPAAHLQRSVGFYGLTFISLGSIIGSGWLLGALTAAEKAGPAAVLSWALAAVILSVLALVYAELGAAYPVAGGTARFPYFSHGPLAGFVSGLASWLQAVAIAPIEILAALSYLNSLDWVRTHVALLQAEGPSKGLLTGTGLMVAASLLLGFTALNLAGARFLAESNTVVVIWKALVPAVAVVAIASLSFHPENFTAAGFMPYGWHGVFAALPAGVVFALQGFEQAVQLAGEARDPQRDISRAIITAMAVGAVLYTLLQLAFVAGVNPADVAHGWHSPLGGNASDYGAWYTLALAVGATWLAVVLIVDAVISPAGTGIVYVGTSARLGFALGEERELPRALTRTNRHGAPVTAVLLSAGVGLLAFGPFPSWNKMVGVVTGSTAIMYAFAPVALAALHRQDPRRERPYRMPAPDLLLPAAFCAANLLLYWGGFDTLWKLLGVLAAGAGLFAVGSRRAGTDLRAMLPPAAWIPVWLGGMLIISRFGRYGEGSTSTLPDDVDLAVVVAFSLIVFHWAVDLAMPRRAVARAITRDLTRRP